LGDEGSIPSGPIKENAVSGLKDMSGKSQAEREANCQQRLAKHRAMPANKRRMAWADGLNYTFQGGFSGVYHAAAEEIG
jgi:hypothetical protein